MATTKTALVAPAAKKIVSSKPAVAAAKPAAKPAAKSAAPAKKGFPAKGIARKELTPAEAKAKAKLLAARKEMLAHPAPSDMKVFSMELTLRTMKDSFFDPAVKAERVKGRWDNPDAKRFDMTSYDAATVAALVARLQACVHATNVTKRLTPNSAFGLVLRVGVNVDGNVRVSLQACKRMKIVKDKKKWVWYDKTKDTDKVDLDYRKIKRAIRQLSGAFISCQLPPAGRQPKEQSED